MKINRLISVMIIASMLCVSQAFAEGRYEDTDRGIAYIVTDEPEKIPVLSESSITLLNAEGTWHEDANGWWFEYSGGGYPSNTWEEIDSYWYYFNESGYMITGWIQVGDFWYFCETSAQATAPHGSMITGWREVDNEWYFFETAGTDERPLGAMITGWHTWDGNKYYFREINEGGHPVGAMVNDRITIGGLLYEFNDDGTLHAVSCPVARCIQEKDNWCWAASAEMIGKYRNPASTKTQEDIVLQFYTYPGDVGGLTIMMPSALKYVGEDKIRDTKINGGPLEFEEIIASVENDEPFVGVLIWSNSGLIPNGHMVAIVGYAEKTEEIKMIDPWEDTGWVFAPYNQAVNEYQFPTGLGKYTNSVLAYKS